MREHCPGIRALRSGLALAPCLIAVGCGNESGDGGSISKSEFIAKANQICARGNAEIDAAFGFTREPSQRQATVVVTQTVLPIIQREIDQTRDLGYPEGDEEKIEAMVEDTEQVLDELRNNPARLFKDPDPFAEVMRRESAYGVTECGK